MYNDLYNPDTDLTNPKTVNIITKNLIMLYTIPLKIKYISNIQTN